MLVLVPQFLTRAAERLFVKVCYYQKTSKYNSQFNPRKTNSATDRSNEDSKYVFGFRELPVDCPSNNLENKGNLNKSCFQFLIYFFNRCC